MDNIAPPLDVWACLELMGHVRLFGRVTEEERFGAKIGRIDIPTSETAWKTQYFGPASLYRMTPCTEELARESAGYRPRQIGLWRAPAPRFPATAAGDDDGATPAADPVDESAIDGGVDVETIPRDLGWAALG